MAFGDSTRALADTERKTTVAIAPLPIEVAASDRGACQGLGAGDSCGRNAMWERLVNDATVVAEWDARILVMGHAQFRAVKALAVSPEADAHACHIADRGPEPIPPPLDQPIWPRASLHRKER